MEDPSADKKLLNNTLEEELKPIILERWEFEKKAMSKLTSVVGHFGLPGLIHVNQDPPIFQEIVLWKYTSAVGLVDGRFLARCWEKDEFRNLDVIINICGKFSLSGTGSEDKSKALRAQS